MDALARGFTLIELMVVLAIVAVLTAVSATLASGGDASRAQAEAKRLAALLELAAAESRASGETLAWRPERRGYAFWRKDEDGEWVRFPATSPYRPRVFPGEVSLEAQPALLAPVGLVAPLAATVRGGGLALSVTGGLLGRFSVARLHAD